MGHQRLRFSARRARRRAFIVPRAGKQKHVSVILCKEERVLLFKLKESFVRPPTPNLWSPPCNLHSEESDPFKSAANVLLVDTGIRLPDHRFEQIVHTDAHQAFVVLWTRSDGPLPDIPLPPGAEESRFFSADSLPTLYIEPLRAAIREHLQKMSNDS